MRLEVNEEDVLEAMEMGQSYNALSVDHSIEADKDGLLNHNYHLVDP
jgi:RNA polymerase sigma-B factor